MEAEVTGDVRNLLIGRRNNKFNAITNKDNNRIALVIEGGAMRGVISGGMVSALQALGLRDCFDLVVGTSAGASAGAYFLANQAPLGASIYYEDLTGREWIDYSRALRGHPILDLDYLFDDIMKNRKRLDTSVVLNSPTTLAITATRSPDFQPVILTSFDDGDALLRAMRASSTIPLLTRGGSVFDGQQLFDGSLTEAIPIESALQMGSTHALVLLTKPQGVPLGKLIGVKQRFVYPLLNVIQRGLGDTQSTHYDRYDRELKKSTMSAPEIRAIQVDSTSTEISQLNQDSSALFNAAKAGADAVFKAFGAIRPSSFELYETRR